MYICIEMLINVCAKQTFVTFASVYNCSLVHEVVLYKCLRSNVNICLWVAAFVTNKKTSLL